MTVVYTRRSCAPCQMVKKYLKNIGVEYEERPIEMGWDKELQSTTGMMTTPVTVQGSKVVVGANFQQLSALKS